jgi:hypothetical protein
MRDAGLAIADAPPGAKAAPQGTDYLMNVEVARVGVEKRFGDDVTVHGRYFTMHSIVELHVMLVDGAGHNAASFAVSGAEDEPPAPVGAEIFLPLETEPEESLSVAMSRAAGALVLSPQFRAAIERPASR